MRRSCCLVVVLCLTISVVAGQPWKFPFQNPNLPIDQRVDNILSLLTLEEKVAQMSHGGDAGNGPAPPIERLGINPFQWGTECLRGDVTAGLATAFPQALGLSASFNTTLLYTISNATAVEVRAKYNNYTAHGEYGYHMGIACWSPVINIYRQPLWGRGQETYGEDPFLTGEMTEAFVTGLQGPGPTLAALAACKHFDAYCGPENVPVSRFSFDAIVAEKDLAMTFWPAWEACAAAGARSIMCSFNEVNGVPSCANGYFITTMLRETWGFDGYVVSDQDAIEFMIWGHNYTKTFKEAGVLANMAGVDLEDCDFTNNSLAQLVNATNEGLIDVSYIDASVTRLFTARMLLGEFNPVDKNPYATLNLSNVNSPAHQRLAVEAVEQTIVLLENDGTLPLNAAKLNTVCLVGPQVNFSAGLMGDYSPTPAFVITPLQGISEYLAANGGANVQYARGCEGEDVYCYTYNKTEIAACVSGADVVILVMGLSTAIESEGNDRYNISLPNMQPEVIMYTQSLVSVPTVMVYIGAGPVDIAFAIPTTSAIVGAFYPSQASGAGIANVLFGEFNPAGRLPVTWPASMDQIPPMTNYTMVGRTYRYFQGTPLYPFGYGLSYTQFAYTNMQISATSVEMCDSLSISVTVKNVGGVAGGEVVQAYIAWSNATTTVPQLQLVGFTRVFLNELESTTVSFTITPRMMAYVFDNSTEWMLEAGTRTLYMGGQQPNQATSAPSNVLSESFDLMGPATRIILCGESS